MQYDLALDPTVSVTTFYIQCKVEARPETLKDLQKGITDGSIDWQYGYRAPMKRLWKRLERKGVLLNHPGATLTSDFRTQRPIRHNINWIPTDRL